VDGWLAYQRSDYAGALRIWGQLADQGLAGAQFDLGFMHANGRGVPQNYEQALFRYREAADQGYAYAQDEVGSMYANGQGVPQDYAQVPQGRRAGGRRRAVPPRLDVGQRPRRATGLCSRSYVVQHCSRSRRRIGRLGSRFD
jgi:uncharacterized protein